MPERLSVTHVVLSLDLGGLERVVLDLIRRSAELGQQTSVICLDRRGRLAETAESLGATVVSIDKRPGIRIGTLRDLDRAIRRLRPDVVHTHQIGVLFYAGPVARRLGLPVIHTEHGKHFPGTLRFNCLGRLAGRFADRFLCVSREIAELVVKVGVARRKRVAVLLNGIDVTAFEPATAAARAEVLRSLGLPEDALILGTAGRLAPVKRYDRLIDAFDALRRDRPSLRLLLIGDGPIRHELEAQVASLGLGDLVCFAGYQSDLRTYLKALDVFALTSHSEGMPLSVLEAWGTGLPVVVPNVGGLPDMVEPDVTGLLVDATDPSRLNAGLARVLDDPALRARLGEAGRSLALASYDLGPMAAAYDREYRSVVERRQGVAV